VVTVVVPWRDEQHSVTVIAASDVYMQIGVRGCARQRMRDNSGSSHASHRRLLCNRMR
jgi:hypothetical protein